MRTPLPIPAGTSVVRRYRITKNGAGIDLTALTTVTVIIEDSRGVRRVWTSDGAQAETIDKVTDGKNGWLRISYTTTSLDWKLAPYWIEFQLTFADTKIDSAPTRGPFQQPVRRSL